MTDVFACIDRALLDPDLHEMAVDTYVRLVAQALRDKSARPSGVRGSDAGGCRAAVWSSINDQAVRPPVMTQLTKLDPGNLLGLWYSCLLKHGFEAVTHNGVCDLEVEGSYGGVVFHADAALAHVLDDGKLYYEQVVEQKFSYFTKAFDGVPSYHRIQACQQALGLEAPVFTVCTWQPASWREEDKRNQTDFVTAEWELDVQHDLLRLSAAREATMPVGDPVEKWRCKNCWSTACDRSPFSRKIPA